MNKMFNFNSLSLSLSLVTSYVRELRGVCSFYCFQRLVSQKLTQVTLLP